MNAVAELSAALASQDALLTWLAVRGWGPNAEPPPGSPRRSLSQAVHLAPTAHLDAPNVLFLWEDTLTERAADGARLRLLQREMNTYADALRERPDVPALALVGSPELLLSFPLQGDPFARRLRFTPKRLSRTNSPLVNHFQRFRAETMAAWIVRPDEDSLFSTGAPSWTFTELFVGSALDQGFVDFMTWQRRDLTRRVLSAPALLDDMLDRLRERGQPRQPASALPHDRTLRTALIASVDTVLLRLVLYRYLEAQFGHTATDDERKIAFGSYDQLLTQVDVDREGVAKAQKQTERPSLFPNLVRLVDQGRFTEGVRRRGEVYRSDAGGDLHQGAIAESADVLDTWLLDNAPESLALLLHGTSTEEYSFHFADLDPRAFQDFYQQTIGTDIHVRYDPSTGQLAAPDVVDRRRNRKEQGAYYTTEALARWLVERTVGVWFDEWKRELDAGRDDEAKLAAALDRLLDLRVLDPTCGGGMFLRATFEYLSKAREGIVQVVGPRPITTKGRYTLFREEASPGEWEWHLLLHVLYGIDVDVKALNVASNLLTLSALTYKRNGVCFPSFVNVSLKKGNSLVVPLPETERARFCEDNVKELLRLLELRATLRNPSLLREPWKAAHEEAERITRKLTDERIRIAFAPLFPAAEVVERVRRVGCFLYEAELPEVFFEVVPGKRGKQRVALRPNPGFDIVLGNPPWEEPAAEMKQFLPEFDPAYADQSGNAAAEREKELLADPEIKRRWEEFTTSIDDFKAMLAGKGLLDGGWYRHQRRSIRGKIPGAHTNLYKYVTELAWRLLRDGGRAGLVVDGGLWTDVASSGLRALLIDHSQTEAICGFVNRKGIFEDVHKSYKISAFVFKKGGRTETVPAAFMQDDLAALARFDAIRVPLSADAIRSDRRDNYPIPEVRSLAHLALLHRIEAPAMLEEAPWFVDTLAEELNAGRQRAFYRTVAASGDYPLVDGTQFNRFGVFAGEPPKEWVDPSDAGAGGFVRSRQANRVIKAIISRLEESGPISGGKEAAAKEWLHARTGESELPRDWVRLDWEGYRLAWRDIARNDDRRTLLAGILPPRVALTHTAPHVRPFRLTVTESGVSWALQYPLDQLLYLAGMLASFSCDAVVRTRLAKTHLTSETFAALPVPPWTGSPDDRRIAELTARLTCLPADAKRSWADYTDLAAAVGLTPARDGLADVLARRDAEVEINVLVARRYGLSREDVIALMDLLFMTPEHKVAHTKMRDLIAAGMR